MPFRQAMVVLLLILWPARAWALTWWVASEQELAPLQSALDELWPGHAVELRVGMPAPEGEGVRWQDQVLVLLRQGQRYRADGVADLPTQVLLVRSWTRQLAQPSPPPDPPEPAPRAAPAALHAQHLLPGVSSAQGLELGMGTVLTFELRTDPLDVSAKGYAPLFDLSARYGRLGLDLALWNLWEPERSYRPVALGGVSLVIVRGERLKLGSWVGFAGGISRASSCAGAPVGLLGGGLAMEWAGRRFAWDASLPLTGALWRAQGGEEGVSIQSAYALSCQRSAHAVPLFTYPEAGVSWRVGPQDSLRFGLLAHMPSFSWRHDWDHAFLELAAATELLASALRMQTGVRF